MLKKLSSAFTRAQLRLGFDSIRLCFNPLLSFMPQLRQSAALRHPPPRQNKKRGKRNRSSNAVSQKVLSEVTSPREIAKKQIARLSALNQPENSRPRDAKSNFSNYRHGKSSGTHSQDNVTKDSSNNGEKRTFMRNDFSALVKHDSDLSSFNNFVTGAFHPFEQKQIHQNSIEEGVTQTYSQHQKKSTFVFNGSQDFAQFKEDTTGENAVDVILATETENQRCLRELENRINEIKKDSMREPVSSAS